jgi:hypothetical protein
MSNFKDIIVCTCESGKILMLDKNLSFLKKFGPSQVEKLPNIEHSNENISFLHSKSRIMKETDCCVLLSVLMEPNYLLEALKVYFHIFNIFLGVYCYDTSSFQLNFKIPVESGIVWKLLYLK